MDFKFNISRAQWCVRFFRGVLSFTGLSVVPTLLHFVASIKPQLVVSCYCF